MRRYLRFGLYIVLGFFVLITLALVVLAQKPEPERITYGISFNVPYARELSLDPLTVFDAFIQDLGVRHFRLAAHWPLVEPKKGIYDFEIMDTLVARAEQANATIIMGVGRRLPRWPECHVPKWASELSWEEQKDEIRAYLRTVVNRYKDSPAIIYWQVENEPFLTIFAKEYCGELDEAFLEEEVALVHELDPTRPILVTDSGNLGTWRGAYQLGDAFGTSVYVHFWNPDVGTFRTIIPAWFYRVKENLLAHLYGTKKTMLIELSLEPWLLEPVTDVPLDVQFTRMNLEFFDEILKYAEDTRFDTQYLWGGEWWYWLKEQGEDAMWERGKKVFSP